MFAGSASFWSAMPGLKFGCVDVSVTYPGVAQVELIAENGKNVAVGVRLTAVPTVKEGLDAARAVAERVLNRLAFAHDRGISDPVLITSSINPMNPPPGHIDVVNDCLRFVSERPTLTLEPDALPRLKAALEQVSPIGERHYGLFRSALAASDPVVRFLQLYHMLLFLCNDNQEDVDVFIGQHERGVLWTPYPPERKLFKKSKTSWKETTYTRLRNELAHPRAGVSIETTKREMGNHVPGLIPLTKKAIELNP